MNSVDWREEYGPCRSGLTTATSPVPSSSKPDCRPPRGGGSFLPKLGAALAALGLFAAGPALADKLEDATAAFAEQQDSAALKLLNEAIVESRDRPATLSLAYFQRGEVLASGGKYQRALDDFNTALHLPQSEEQRALVLVARAETYGSMGRYPEACEDYGRSLALQPDQIGVFSARGELHLNRGNMSAALADYEAELAIHPKFYRALSGRAVILGLPMPPDPTKGR